MGSRHACSLIILCLPVLLLSGCTSGPTFDMEAQRILGPGEFLEVNLELEQGDAVRATWSTEGGPVTWDVHSHGDDGSVLSLQEGTGERGTITHQAAVAGPHSLLWVVPRDASGPVDLAIDVAGSGVLVSVHPSDGDAETDRSQG